MKRFLIAAVLLFAVAFSTVSCVDQLSGEYTIKDYTSNLSYANNTGSNKVYDLALNKNKIDKNIAYVGHLPIYKCETKQELSDFKSKFSSIFEMKGTWNEVPSFESVIVDFNDLFFVDNTVFIIYIPTNSCTYRFDVDEILYKDGTITFYIEETVHPTVVDEAMGGWLLTISIPKEFLDDDMEYDVFIYEY